EIARQLDLDRKTVRSILEAAAWQPYARADRADTLLAEHASYLTSRAPAVQYSARILYQELRRSRHYHGSYEPAQRFVRPFRSAADGVRAGRGGPGRPQCDLQTVCPLLRLRAARVPPLPRADEGQGRIGGAVLQAQLPPRARLHRRAGSPGTARPVAGRSRGR